MMYNEVTIKQMLFTHKAESPVREDFFLFRCK